MDNSSQLEIKGIKYFFPYMFISYIIFLNIFNNNIRFYCTKALFKPLLLAMEACGIHETINNSIMKCGVEFRRQMSSYIVMSGDNIIYPGFAARMLQ
jgi:actin-related protein